MLLLLEFIVFEKNNLKPNSPPSPSWVFSLLRLAFIFSSSTKDNLIILHEDNVTYIAHIKGYIKHNRVKHKSSKFFYSHKLPKNSKN